MQHDSLLACDFLLIPGFAVSECVLPTMAYEPKYSGMFEVRIASGVATVRDSRIDVCYRARGFFSPSFSGELGSDSTTGMSATNWHFVTNVFFFLVFAKAELIKSILMRF